MTENIEDILDTEYGIDSRYKSKTEREYDATALMEARLMKIKKPFKKANYQG